ncbi:MAG: acyl-homoserine-lactone synthase [Rhizobiaceae bacterium]
MIRYIDMPERKHNSGLIKGYYKLRKRVFCDALGWVPPKPGGMEHDEFDEAYNVVILDVDEKTGEVFGGVRLMPTTGPTLMHTVWRDMLPDPDDFRSPNIWEATRFCVDNVSNGTRKRNFVNRATLALSLAVLEFCSSNGIDSVVGVCEKKFFDMQRIYGTRAEILSSMTDANGTEISCGLWSTSAAARSVIAWARPFIGSSEPLRLKQVA